MFGEKLKQLRNNMQKTQDEVATKIGLSRAAYSHLENNRNEPDAETLSKLATYYNVTIDYLLGQSSAPKWADQKDVTDLKEFLDGNVNMAYGGEDLTSEEQAQLKVALTQIFWKKRKQERN